MREREYGNAIVAALRSGHPAAVEQAIDWLKANLTDAALHGCHHCGEADRDDAPCRWCGLRDKPKRVRRTTPEHS